MPLNIHDFAELRNKDLNYSDKTELIFKLVHEEQFAFLCRPPKFGKTLLLSTIKNYFEGHKEFFSGLKISYLENEKRIPWESFPVLTFDFSTFYNGGKNQNINSTELFFEQLKENASRLNVSLEEDSSPSKALTQVLKKACASFKQPAVVLFDEFFAPLQSGKNIAEDVQFAKDICASIKAAGQNIRFALFTSYENSSIMQQLPVKDISFSSDYKELCGFTKEELTRYFAHEVAMVAATTEVSPQTVLNHLLNNYGGYRFTSESKNPLYNPFDLLKLFGDYKWNHFWAAELTKNIPMEFWSFLKFAKPEAVQKISMYEFTKEKFAYCLQEKSNVIPKLFFTGIISIKSFDSVRGTYRLDFPNQESKDFFEKLILSVKK